MDITDTPAYAEIMGEPYKYDPVMPSPSDYSRPDMEPSAPVDDFSSMIIPSGIPSYMKRDISGVWHDTSRFTDPPPGYDWRTGLGAGDAGGGESISAASMSDDDRLAEALERLASIPAGFVGGPEKTMTRIDATGGLLAPFGGVGDYTTPGGFYTPITPLTGITPPTFSSDFWDPSTAPVDPLAAVWT